MTENLDCVEVKRHAQHTLLREIRGKSLREELAALHRLAEESPFWKRLRKSGRVSAAKSDTAAGKKCKTD